MAELMRLAKYSKRIKQDAWLFSWWWGLGGSWQWEDWLIGSWHWQVGSKRRKVVDGRGCRSIWWMVQGLFCVPVLIFATMCFSICVTYWHPNTVKTTLHLGQWYSSPPTGDSGAVWSPQHSAEPREIVEQHPWRATTRIEMLFLECD